MAEVLEIQQLLAQKFEPKRSFRWLVEIDGIDTFLALSSDRPKMTFGETEIPFLNTTQYFAGKGKWEHLNMAFVDAIAPSQAQKFMEWCRSQYEPETGRAGYKEQYSKTINLKMLSPNAEVVEKWTLKNTWVVNFTPSAGDYNSEDFAKIDVTLRYDRAILNF